MRAIRWIGWALALAGAASSASAQAAAGDGGPDSVRLSFPARPGVCGAGDGILIRDRDGSTSFVSGHRTRTGPTRWEEGEPPCREGPVTVVATRRAGRWDAVRVSVGGAPGEPPGSRVVGRRLTGQAAADLLLGAVPDAEDGAARSLILGASLAADAVIWPEMARLARDRSLTPAVRKSALFWLGQRAAREAGASLDDVIRDPTEADEIREAAVFGLSQLPADDAIPRLISVVRTVDDPRVRSRALFWLAGFDDPRAVDLFEDLLASSTR
jgi:hypothetical protein